MINENYEITYSNIRRRADGTFIINMNGYDFHVTPDYPTKEMYGEDYTFEKLSEYAESYPDEVTEYVEPELPQPSEETLKQARIVELEAEVPKIIANMQVGIDLDVNNQQTLLYTLLEIEELKGNLE